MQLSSEYREADVQQRPLTGVIGGRTDHRCDSRRVRGEEGVSFGPEPDLGEAVVFCGLGQEDQVVEGKAKVTRPGLESECGLRARSVAAAWW